MGFTYTNSLITMVIMALPRSALICNQYIEQKETNKLNVWLRGRGLTIGGRGLTIGGCVCEREMIANGIVQVMIK